MLFNVSLELHLYQYINIYIYTYALYILEPREIFINS